MTSKSLKMNYNARIISSKVNIKIEQPNNDRVTSTKRKIDTGKSQSSWSYIVNDENDIPIL